MPTNQESHLKNVGQILKSFCKISMALHLCHSAQRHFWVLSTFSHCCAVSKEVQDFILQWKMSPLWVKGWQDQKNAQKQLGIYTASWLWYIYLLCSPPTMAPGVVTETFNINRVDSVEIGFVGKFACRPKLENRQQRASAAALTTKWAEFNAAGGTRGCGHCHV